MLILAYLEEVCRPSHLDYILLTLSIVLRDVAERGRDIEGCIKQWFAFVKPNFEKYVEPQRKVADIIVPRGVENRVAICELWNACCRQLLITSSYGCPVHRPKIDREVCCP